MNRPAYSGAYSRRRFSNYGTTEKENVGSGASGYTLNVTSGEPSMGEVGVEQLTDVSPLSSQSAAQDGPSSNRGLAAGAKFRAKAAPFSGYRFVKWDTNIDGVGNTATNPIEFKLTKNTTLVAHFERVGTDTPATRTANISWDGKMGRVNGNGLVLDPSAREGKGSITTTQGSTVTLTASPLAGYHFVRWAGGPSNGTQNSATYTFQMNNNYNIKAEFAADDPGTGSGNGGGNVIGGGGGGGSTPGTPTPTVTTVSKKETGVKAFVKKWWWAILIVAYVVYKERKGGSK